MEVESTKAVKKQSNMDTVYKREFERLLGGYFFTNAHEMVMVVRENMCSPPLWR